MNKPIPQIDFDRAVEKIMSAGLANKPAENIVISLWKSAIALNLKFTDLVNSAVATGKLDVSQSVLDYLNAHSLPDDINYKKIQPVKLSKLVERELRSTSYVYTTEDGHSLITEDDRLIIEE
jgi:hypothetical protein